MLRTLRVDNCPSDDLAYTNKAFILTGELPSHLRYVRIENSENNSFIFTIQQIDKYIKGSIAFNVLSRKWAQLSKDEQIKIFSYSFNPNNQYISKLIVKVDFYQKNNATPESFDTDFMAKEFSMQFALCSFTKGQKIAFKIADKKLLLCTIHEIFVVKFDNYKLEETTTTNVKIDIGLLLPDSIIIFEKEEQALINLIGKSKSKYQQQSLINPNWDFQNLGIGGLDTEFNAIFRRAFASRVFPIELIEQLGIKHVRGILLYGPPGTGKTLIARQIGKMLNAREPKIVNGPQILDKYVGESEANIRRLFEDAETEFKKVGNNSALHIIIFDEIDAICKARGSVAGNSGVHDTVVNQLLSKMDGVESLNNILVIGMTNRKDMIDEALMRPGRMEVQLEISLPDEEGRLQILNIHTSNLKKFNKLAKDVDLKEIAKLTLNFSGAEIEGLIRAAQSTAINRLVKASKKVEIDPDALQKLIITKNDILFALENDVKPAFGTSQEEIERLISKGIILWGPSVKHLLEEAEFLIKQVKDVYSSSLVTILLEGSPKSGKTALGATIALSSKFPFVKLCTPETMIGFTETAKCHLIKKVFDDAYKSTFACIIIDNIERLLDYAAIGPRFSNLVLQALLVLLNKLPPKGKNLLVICTSSSKNILDELELSNVFSKILHCSILTEVDHVLNVLNFMMRENDPNSFTKEELLRISKRLKNACIHVEVRRLLDFIEIARQFDIENRLNKFLCILEEENCIETINN